MKFIKKYARIIAFDFLAVLCFIGVILFGWLPGPGGIPLFLAGLGLLAVNHDWAERLLEHVKYHGMSLKKKLFPKNPWIRALYDVLSVSLAIVVTYLLFTTDHKIILGLSFAGLVFSLFVFLVNRERFDKFSTYLKKNKL